MSTSSFVWYELMTTNPEAAAAFYRDVMGWRTEDSGLPGQTYTILSVEQTPIGGLMGVPPHATGAQPGWLGYVGVDDVDGMAARVSKAKGAIHRAPADIPGVGRFAVVADPHGAAFVLFKGTGDGPPPRPAPQTPGHIGWHELSAGDLESAFAFYAELFGWTKADAIPMGPLGIYQMFAIDGVPVGGMMAKPEVTPAPRWLYYVNVAEIDAVEARVTHAGGRVLVGPQQVPGGSWILQCVDPQGAAFALVAPRRA